MISNILHDFMFKAINNKLPENMRYFYHRVSFYGENFSLRPQLEETMNWFYREYQSALRNT